MFLQIIPLRLEARDRGLHRLDIFPPAASQQNLEFALRCRQLAFSLGQIGFAVFQLLFGNQLPFI